MHHEMRKTIFLNLSQLSLSSIGLTAIRFIEGRCRLT